MIPRIFLKYFINQVKEDRNESKDKVKVVVIHKSDIPETKYQQFSEIIVII